MSPASAATQDISITRSGYVPLSQTVKVGDTIAFTNADTAAHQVVFKQTGGFTCTATPLVVAPTRTQSCTFTVADKYTYTDPNQNGNAWNGTITVETKVAASVSLDASPATLVVGSKVTLSGKTTPGNSGTSVDIMAMATGATGFTKIATILTTAGGTFTTTVTPEVGRTSYRADFQSGGSKISSSVQTVEVRPVAASVSLNASPATIVYGGKVTLTGKTTPSSNGTSVDIMAMETGDTGYTKVATATTSAGGNFSATLTPEIGTNYRAEFTSGGSKITSSVQTVQVRPNVTLALRFVKNGRAYFKSKVISSITYTGKTLKVQRKNRLGGWTTLRTVTIGNFSNVRFRIKLPAGISRIRTVLRTSQAGSGYITGVSNVVAVKR
jgi:plastocyanin